MANMLIQVLTTFLIIHKVLANNCGPDFHNKCSCGLQYYEEEEQYVVNCTDVGFHNTSILELMPDETQVLIFTGNYLESLEWNIFGSINKYNSLRVIDMSNNHIREIRGKTYHHVQNVRRLMLNHNNLSISRNDDDEINHHHPRVFSNFINLESLHLTNAFSDNTSAELSYDLHDIFVNSNLTKLQKLHLEQNEISNFKDPRVFCDLPNLTDLHLGDNNLKEINFHVQCLKNLRFLDLERNKFEYVKVKDLSTLDALQGQSNRQVRLMVDLTLNPFLCDCRLNSLHNWLDVTKVDVRHKDDLVCYKSKNFFEKITSLVPGQCADETQEPQKQGKQTNDHTVILVFLLAILVFILIGLVAALLYVSRDKIKYIISPVLDNVSKKVQYTTIKDEECPEVHV